MNPEYVGFLRPVFRLLGMWHSKGLKAGMVQYRSPSSAGRRKKVFEFGSVTHWCSSGRLWFLVCQRMGSPVLFRKACEKCRSSCYLLQPRKIYSVHAVCSGELRSLLLLIHGIFSSFSL